MKIIIIVAMSQNSVIGLKINYLGIYLRTLKILKKLHLNHCVIMGRKTYDSIGKPLKDRRNIVLVENNSL